MVMGFEYGFFNEMEEDAYLSECGSVRLSELVTLLCVLS